MDEHGTNMVPGRDPALCPVCEEPRAGGCHVCPGPPARQEASADAEEAAIAANAWQAVEGKDQATAPPRPAREPFPVPDGETPLLWQPMGRQPTAWVNRGQARQMLAQLGFDKPETDMALEYSSSASRGYVHTLPGHRVRYDHSSGTWMITRLADNPAEHGFINGFTGLTYEQATEALTGGTFGYSPAQAEAAIDMAGSADGAMGILDRHVIYLLADGITIEPLSGPPVAGQPQQHRGSRWPELDRERDVGEILARIEAVDAHLDEAAPWQFRENPVANRWRRVTKVCEESGEVWRALSGWDGENPRKGACGSRDELLAELGDTAVAALLAIQSLVKNLSQTWAVFLAALDKARGRVLDHQARGGPALPPESGTAGQAAYDNGITG